MEIEYVIIYAVRLALLIGSGCLIPNQIIKAKTAWMKGDDIELKRSIGYIWAGILFLLLAVQSFGSY